MIDLPGIHNFTDEDRTMSYMELVSEARNPATAEARLRHLATTQDLIRGMVATNPNCPLDLLETLAEDPEDGVRRLVAQNPRTPLDVQLLIVAEIGLVASSTDHA
jgi:hypothetical protein